VAAEQKSVEETLGALKRHGVTLPKHPSRQEEYASQVSEMYYRLDTSKPRHMERTASAEVSGYHASSQLAIPRYFEPRSNFGDGRHISMVDMQNDDVRRQMHAWCRLFAATHPIIGSCIDIYSRFPVVGMEFICEDPELQRFYTELFIEDLEFEDFAVDLGKEYWTVGETFPYGAWDEDLGVWVGEELLSPDDMVVHRVPLTGEKSFKLKPSKYMTDLVLSRTPYEEYTVFVQQFADLVPFIEKRIDIPVSSDVVSHVARFDNRRDVRGTPVLTRALRSLMLEDRLESAMQATADRLYAPLALFKLGMADLGDGRSWVPSPDQLDSFRQELDLALASDFRAIVTHFAIDVEEVFQTSISPKFTADRQYIDERLFMTFGMSADLLKTSGSSPYASSALRIEFINQMLSTYQNIIKKHWKKRALVVARAQGHYATEKKGTSRVPVMERYLVVDDEGNKKIEERAKLLIPTLQMKTMNLRDEKAEREFLKVLRDGGVPIPDRDLMVGIPYDWEESMQRKQEEDIKKAVVKIETDTIIAKAAQERGMVTVVDPMTGDTSFKSYEQAAMEADQAEAEAAAMAEQAAGGAGSSKEAPTKDTSATGGGGRPNVSDEKKKDEPKPKKAASKKSEAQVEDEPDEAAVFPPPEKISFSLVHHTYDPSIDGGGDDAPDV
jgi:hypothetical protein